jgi:hypothetical protein
VALVELMEEAGIDRKPFKRELEEGKTDLRHRSGPNTRSGLIRRATPSTAAFRTSLALRLPARS